MWGRTDHVPPIGCEPRCRCSRCQNGSEPGGIKTVSDERAHPGAVGTREPTVERRDLRPTRERLLDDRPADVPGPSENKYTHASKLARMPAAHQTVRSQRIGRLKSLATTPAALGRAMSLWPPFAGAGIRVRFGADWRHATVTMRHRRLTSNYVGTAFGGSMFAMTDPFWMILVLRSLGDRYVVWDKAGEIEFHTPARATLTAHFDLTDAVLDEIRAAAAGGEKVLRWFTVDLTLPDGTVAATVRKQLYIRLKR